MTESPLAQSRTLELAVIMECRRIANKWADHQWEAVGVVPDPGGESRLLVDEAGHRQWLHPGLVLGLYRDDAENYLLNVTAPEPRVFVMWRMNGDEARPEMVTASYGEAARMLDSGEHVDGVAMPADMREWVESFARAHYEPEERKPRKRYADQRAERQRKDGR